MDTKKATTTLVEPVSGNILSEIRGLIESARVRVAVAVNAELTLLYWRVGERIRREILKEKKAEYGLAIVATLSQQLATLYGKGFESRNLWRMMQFAECFPYEQIVVTLSRQLSWSHFVAIIPVRESLARDLNRLVAIELKLDKFKPEYKGQMELYLRWLDKNERKAGEAHPLGLILCAGKSKEQVELLELGKSGIRVADYLTELPPREILEKKLHQAMQSARLRLEGGKEKMI